MSSCATTRGIIHRDLKPSNIKVREDGTVKMLDFGLAKAMEPAGASSANAMTSPTISMHATQTGIILGTAAYMSPEQSRGAAVDRRADVWSFGVVFFEMLAGRRPFDGDGISDMLAGILKSEPAWQMLPVNTPATIQRLLPNELIAPKTTLLELGPVRCHERLGGVLEFYHREAA